MVYNSLVQAFVDIRNLSDLLSEEPDIVDVPSAVDIPLPAVKSPSSPSNLTIHNPLDTTSSLASYGGVSVEFRNVRFRYPEQAEGRGLRNISFFVRPGTTTAIVGYSG
jgi:ABC-type multidrug transport system fused ATPase/permease subunit